MNPRLWPGLVAAAGLLLLGCRAAPVPPDILLITLDTTRADALGLYGASPSPSPTLDALAAEARVYDEALTVTPLTLPAHASLMTGQYPVQHGIRSNGPHRLSQDAVTVAEQLAGQGYQTAAFVSAVVLDRSFGLDQGFDLYVDDVGSVDARSSAVTSVDSATTTDQFASWLVQEVRDSEVPFFAWVHYYDAHAPYRDHTNGFDDPYASEIAHMDRQLGLALAAAGALDRERPLAVVVAGDHGESLGEHGELTHGFFVYRSTMRVPLLIRAPGVTAGRVAAPVSLVDLAPTILGLAGAPDEDLVLDGVDLRTDGGVGKERNLYGESFVPRDTLGFSELRVVQGATQRYIRAPRPELYGWTTDPAEARDLLADAPSGTAAGWPERLGAFVGLEGKADSEFTAVRGGLEQRLQALGYVLPSTGISSDTPYDQLPDPKDHPAALQEVHEAITRARTQSPEGGIPVLEETLQRFPRAAPLRATLSRGYELTGRTDDAIAVLSADGEPAADAYQALRVAEIQLAAGQAAQALATVNGALAKNPELPDGHLLAAEAHRRLGETAAAASAADHGLALTPDSAQLLMVRGACHQDTGQFDASIPPLRQALERDPNLPDVRYLLSLSLAEAGRYPEATTLLIDQRLIWGTDLRTDVALAKLRLVQGQRAAALDLLQPHATDPDLPADARAMLGELQATPGGAKADQAAGAAALPRRW